VTVNYSEFL